ncbi:MAG: 3-keto-disaccharide hydrolase [bacterium]
MKIILLSCLLLISACSKSENEANEAGAIASSILNTLSEQEKSEGWKLLFDGKTTNGWRGAHKDTFPAGGWMIENGELIVLDSGGGESRNGGDIVTMDEYSNFDLKLEFKLTESANSGIKYFVTEKEQPNGSAIGLEFQILDDERHPDAKLGNHEGSRTVASLYDLIKAENKTVNPMGEWNEARIVSNGRHIEHWLNSKKVLEYERGSEAFRKLVAESKYKIWENFGEAPSGHILLQDHGNKVFFRNIKIKVLQ